MVFRARRSGRVPRSSLPLLAVPLFAPAMGTTYDSCEYSDDIDSSDQLSPTSPNAVRPKPNPRLAESGLAYAAEEDGKVGKESRPIIPVVRLRARQTRVGSMSFPSTVSTWSISASGRGGMGTQDCSEEDTKGLPFGNAGPTKRDSDQIAWRLLSSSFSFSAGLTGSAESVLVRFLHLVTFVTSTEPTEADVGIVLIPAKEAENPTSFREAEEARATKDVAEPEPAREVDTMPAKDEHEVETGVVKLREKLRSLGAMDEDDRNPMREVEERPVEDDEEGGISVL